MYCVYRRVPRGWGRSYISGQFIETFNLNRYIYRNRLFLTNFFLSDMGQSISFLYKICNIKCDQQLTCVSIVSYLIYIIVNEAGCTDTS